MLIKFDSKSARVKGLSFHPRRRWLLVSLHNGVIQLWDYSEKTMIDRYEEHKGPVRGLDFHHHQPLFVSGGDDAKIKVWNYKFRRCLFTLDAHEDYIRSTFFHRENPWIVSASDDQSIRIWNWQSRSRIAVLTGHTHYIMCAQFHPTKELILSASIDQTLRVWDISELKMKNKSKSGSTREEIVTGFPEILTKTDYTVVPNEAHSVEINWCAFHPDPKKQLCLSAADDNYIKIWQLDDRNSLRSVDILRGHYNNVSCATFITMQGKDFIISVSEDKTIKIWDVEKRCAISTHRREADRFWTCAAHPRENLFAAGHDTGVLMFKLEKERPAFCVYQDYLVYIKRRQIIRYNLKTKTAKAVQTLMPRTEMSQYYHRLHCYSFDERQVSNIVVSVRSNKSVYDLYSVETERYGTGKESHRRPGLTAIFIGPNRLAVLDESKHVYFRINDEDRKPKIPIQADEIFEAGSGRLYIKHKVDGVNAISLWDIEKGCGIHSIKVDAKFVIMNDSKTYVACVGSQKITICDGNLKLLSVIQEQRKIKSVVWEDSGVLVYSTPAQIKYSLTDGLLTTIMTIKETLYLVTVRDQHIYAIDRSGNVSTIPIDTREFKFKQAVIKNDRAAILNSIRSLGTLSRCEIAFLVQKGHPGLALKFVQEHECRFPLALRAFDIEEALKSAIHLNKKHHWQQLADTALKIGNVKAVERAYIELKQPYKLGMLYLSCNQRDKMIQARDMARELKDSSTEFVISLLLKDFRECIQIIRRRGHSSLAYLSALNHGLDDLARDILSKGEITDGQLMKLPRIGEVTPSMSLESSIPDIGNSAFNNWPLLNNESEKFEEILSVDEPEEKIEFEDGGDWGNDDWEDADEDKDQLEDLEDAQDQEEDGWQEDDEPLEDLLDSDEDGDNQTAEAPQYSCGQSIESKWVQMSDVALHHILAGSYTTAIGILRNQAGIENIEPLKDIIKDLIIQSRVAYQGLALTKTMYIHPSIKYVSRNRDTNSRIETILPAGGYELDLLSDRLTECYRLFSSGKFNDATVGFRNLLLSTLFLRVNPNYDTNDESNPEAKVKEIVSACREYILALQVWIERKNISNDNYKRSCELAAYFSKLNLPKHRSFVLEKALDVFLKVPKEYHKTLAASSIAQRLLDWLPSDDPKNEKMVVKTRKIMSSFDSKIDQQIQLSFDPSNPYSLCAGSLSPIYQGNKLTSCPLCDAKYKPEFSKSICKVCLVAEVGKICTGIRYRISTSGADD